MDVDTSNRKEQRAFGLVMAAAIVIVTLIHWLIRGDLATWPFYVSGAFLVLGLAAPAALKPVFVVWMKFALVLNWIMTRLLLSIVFFLMITPTRLLMRIFSDDPLKRRFEPDAASYWEEPDEQPDDPARYENMF
ncbi:MAG: hypothetical protein IID09_04050 [Candidatus Hydrogenedentes bacterium]|nr:hypothetical protein [Candidatus Hydrogenedentota bacterium]